MIESLLLDMNFQVLVMLWGYIIFMFSSIESGSLSFLGWFLWFLLIISYVIFWVLKIVILVCMICSQG